MKDVCTGVDVFPLTRGRTLANAALALPRLATPLQMAYSHHPKAERRVTDLACSGRFDVVHVEHMRGVTLSTGVRDLPVVFDAVDSISALFAQTAKHAPSRAQRLAARLDLARSRRFEARAPYFSSRLVVTSAREAEAFVALGGPLARERISIVPNGVDTEYFRPSHTPSRHAVLFTGKLSYHANAAAAIRLVEGIMPIVWGEFPDVPVILAGKGPPKRVDALRRDARVTVTGYVEDMRAVYSHASVAVCPLVYGAGIQNKVLEALASGLATVMTVAAADALSGVPGRDYLTADSDAELARAVTGLLRNERERQRLAEAGRNYVRAHHQWPQLTAQLVRTYEAATHGPRRRLLH